MTITISDLPITDPSVARVFDSMWLGSLKISLTTVLDPVVIQKQIKMFETADICNSCEAASGSQTIIDLTKILSYLT